MAQHELKTWPSFYREIVARKKTFEVRKNDRDYAVGDTLILKEWDPNGGGIAVNNLSRPSGYFTGRKALVQVTYMMPGGRYGVAEDHCVMAVKLKELLA